MQYDVSEAQQYAQKTLTGVLEPLYPHSRGVAEQARQLALKHNLDADKMESIAWLLDVGYSNPIEGIHSLDGAHLLWEHPTLHMYAPYIAWHSTAEWEHNGDTSYPIPEPREQQLLWVADYLTRRTGEATSPQERVDEILARHGLYSLAYISLSHSLESFNHALQEFGYAPVVLPEFP